LRKKHPELVRFVLNRDSQIFPAPIQIWAYLPHPTESTSIRQAGITGMMHLNGQSHVFSEIAFPPFGLILSVEHPPVSAQLCNLTDFQCWKFNAWDVVYLKMPVFPVVSCLPGDFRTVKEIAQTIGENKRLGSYHLNVSDAWD